MREKSSRSAKSWPDFSAVFIVAGGIGLWLLWPGADKYAVKTHEQSLRIPGVFYITEYESKAYLKPDMFAAGVSAGPLFRDEDEFLVPVVLESMKQGLVPSLPEIPIESEPLSLKPFEQLFDTKESLLMPFMQSHHTFGGVGKGKLVLHIEPGLNVSGYGYEVENNGLPERFAGRAWQVRASVDFDETGYVDAVFIDVPHADAAVNRYVEGLLWKSWLSNKPQDRVSGRVIVAAARSGEKAENPGVHDADQGISIQAE